MRLVGRFMVAGSDPRTADFDLAAGEAIPRNLSCLAFGARLAFGTFRAHQANFNKWCGPTLLCAGFILFVFGPIVHVRPETAGGADGSGLGHAPEVLDLQAETIELTNQFERRGGASDQDAKGVGEFTAGGGFFQGVEGGETDGGGGRSVI